ncbi:hypothetical protein ACRFDH_14805 [Klebsiella pneumoniae]
MMMITKKEKAKEPPGTRQAGKGFEKMKIQPIVCRGAEAKPAARLKRGNYAELREPSQIMKQCFDKLIPVF